MTQFQLQELVVENYRCFETLRFSIAKDLTVLFAENGGGKSSLLAALAMGVSVFQRETPKSSKFDGRRDIRKITLDEKGRREPAGPCTLKWIAAVGDMESVEWSTSAHPASGRRANRHFPILQAMEKLRLPGDRWPLFAWYGVERMRRSHRTFRPRERTLDRWEAYEGSLDPNLDDSALLQWLQDEMLGDVARQRQDQPERFFDKAVMEAAVAATPGVVNAWYDPAQQSPMVRFEDGHAVSWSELSDGYHVFLALVADLARRAVMLNELDGAEAPARVEGVVLIDEVDLHLHPRWQRNVLNGLRKAFPRLQFIVTTHSPQVLSSAENHQVRKLVAGRLQEGEVFVEGRDTNAILRDSMNTTDRDEKWLFSLRKLHDAIDDGQRKEAERIFADLATVWGENDPELIRAKRLMDWRD